VAETERLRLVVYPLHTPGGYARFLVLRRNPEDVAIHVLVASGSEESVPAAMRAAERAAARIGLSF
jgi:hypothetical protein